MNNIERVKIIALMETEYTRLMKSQIRLNYHRFLAFDMERVDIVSHLQYISLLVCNLFQFSPPAWWIKFNIMAYGHIYLLYCGGGKGELCR